MLNPITLTYIGTNVATGLWDIFGPKPKPRTPAWGQAAALYSKFMREETGEMEEETMARGRLEAERAGLGSGAAYLEMIGGIQEQRNRILGREISRFGIQQELQKAEWSQKASLAEYQQDIGLKERSMQRLENIGGAIAGHFQEEYREEKGREYRSWFEGLLGETQTAVEQNLNKYNQLNENIEAFFKYIGEYTGIDFLDWMKEQKAGKLGNIDTYNNNTPAPIPGR